MRRTFGILLAVLFCLTPLCLAHHVKQGGPKTLTISTSSAKARDLFKRAMTDYENYHLERANIGWRAAAAEDPDFALAHAWLAFNSRIPAEVSASLQKAKSLEPTVSAGEKLMLGWIVNVRENNYIAGISDMNDLLMMFPNDKQLLYLAGNWLMGQNGYERSEMLFERALTLDKNYPAPLNDLAYCYAKQREFDKALATMDRYVAVLPGEPNPQDSYAELLRMSGKFEPALEHYRAALRIDPQFVSSQLGLGDTYALIGNETQARVEYDKAIQQAQNEADRIDYQIQKAISYVREQNYSEANKSFLAIAAGAHAMGLHFDEAKADRMMAMYDADDTSALERLQIAEEALDHGSITSADREEERSKVFRIQVVRAEHAGDEQQAIKTLAQLESMASGSRSGNIQKSWHGAAGALLVAQKRFAEAIPHLEEDIENPSSLALLAQAYEQTHAIDKFHQMRDRVSATFLPTLEQALESAPKSRTVVAGN